MVFPSRLDAVWQPHPGQAAFLENESKVKVLACGRRWGKTDACAAHILRSLLSEQPTRHVVIAPTLDQARILFDRVEELLRRLLDHEQCPEGPVVRRTPYPKLDWNGHRLTARSGFVGRSLRGNEASDVVIDEAAFVPEALVTEVVMPMLATTDGRMTLISTPRGMNHFWRFFKMGEEGRPGVWSRTAPSAESPFVPETFLEMQRGLISDRAYRVEYNAEFLDSAGRVFRTEAIDACLTARLETPPTGSYCIGVDWGRYDDFTAVAVVEGTRDSARLVAIERLNKASWASMIAAVQEIVNRFPQAVVTCDATGAGDALLEPFKSGLRCASVRGEVFTQSRKARLIDNLAWIIENAALQMEPHPELIRELQHFEAKVTESGSTRLGGMGGFHDDLVIALALACSELKRSSFGLPKAGAVRPFSASKKTSALDLEPLSVISNKAPKAR